VLEPVKYNQQKNKQDDIPKPNPTARQHRRIISLLVCLPRRHSRDTTKKPIKKDKRKELRK